MNIRVVAAILRARTELDDIGRTFRRKNDRRNARKIAEIQNILSTALLHEQEDLSIKIANILEMRAQTPPSNRMDSPDHQI